MTFIENIYNSSTVLIRLHLDAEKIKVRTEMKQSNTVCFKLFQTEHFFHLENELESNASKHNQKILRQSSLYTDDILLISESSNLLQDK